jgi:hypothetical protein
MLVDEIAKRMGYDPGIFRMFGSYPELAEYFELEHGGSIGVLRSWMDGEWHTKDQRERVGASKVHTILMELPFKRIYTTNYDRYLEWACEAKGREYAKIANVGDLARAKEEELHIVKFHGDFDDDDSIVLSESSYFARLALDSALDIKLRADLQGRTVLFIGYSLADINMRLLLYRLHTLWAASRHAASRPKSYLFLTTPNPVQERILQTRGIEPIVSDSDDPGEGLLNFLQSVRDHVL